MRFVVAEALGEAEVAGCRALAARVHRLAPGEEPAGGWPERWLRGVAEGRLVATIGLSGPAACRDRLEGPGGARLREALDALGRPELAELRLLSVEPSLSGYRFARLLLAHAYSRRFLAAAGGLPQAVLHAATSRTFQALERALGVHSRPLSRTGDGAAAAGGEELRLILPEQDVPQGLREAALPALLSGRTLRAVTPVPVRRRFAS